MRAVVQRVSRAEVFVEGVSQGSIRDGLVVLLGIQSEDTKEEASWLINKLVQLRVFEDDAGKMNLSLEQTGGGIALVSQFTLFGNVRKGTRPSFNRAAVPDEAIPMYEAFVRDLGQRLGTEVVTGEFGANMAIDLVNDGPVTLILDTRDKRY